MSGRKKSSRGKEAGGLGRLARWATWLTGALLVLAVGVVIGVTLGPSKRVPVEQAVAPTAPPVAYPPSEGAEPDAIDLPPPVVMAPPLELPPPASPAGDVHGWRKYAVASPDPGGRPMIAIVIDDLGIDRKRSDKVVDLPGPLTAAFMSYAKDVARQAEAARRKGHELLLHMPMEPQSEAYDPGPDVLAVGLPAQETRRRLAQALDRFEGLIGLNNHMGSKFTADPAGMELVMEELSQRGLMFLDSLTTGRSVGLPTARRAGVPAVGRDVFLDNDPAPAAVRAQLEKTEQAARRHGHAIAIGHPHDGTIEALAAWLPTLQAKGFVLVPLSAIVKRQYPAG